MDTNLREQLRINLLHQAEAASAYGLTDSAYLRGARTQGYRVELEDVKREVDYLADKKFLAVVPKALSPELRKHRITAEGRDFLATEG